jgi:hypothetical protein
VSIDLWSPLLACTRRCPTMAATFRDDADVINDFHDDLLQRILCFLLAASEVARTSVQAVAPSLTQRRRPPLHRLRRTQQVPIHPAKMLCRLTMSWNLESEPPIMVGICAAVGQVTGMGCIRPFFYGVSDSLTYIALDAKAASSVIFFFSPLVLYPSGPAS